MKVQQTSSMEETRTKLAILMDEQNIRVEVMAVHVNKSAESIKSYRAGRTTPDATTAILIAGLLGTTVEEVFGQPLAQAA